MIIEIDAGNTRIKWRCWQQGKISGYGVLLTRNISDLGADIEAVGIPGQIRFSSVAGEMVQQVVTALSEKWGCSLFVAKTSAEAVGVRCGYLDPSPMGVDRWLAVIAAYHRVKGACVVVDAGSAITVDLVDDEGQHLGGYIVPGFGLIRAALSGGTSDVRVPETGVPSTSPGRTTQEAVNHGALLMIKGLVESAVGLLGSGSDDSDPGLIVTGGDASYLQPVLPGAVQLVPELVMDGLSLVSPNGY